MNTKKTDKLVMERKVKKTDKLKAYDKILTYLVKHEEDLKWVIEHKNDIKWVLEHKDEVEWVLENKDDLDEILEEKWKVDNTCDRCDRVTRDTTYCEVGNHRYNLCFWCKDNHPGRCPESPSRSRYDCMEHFR